MTIASEISRLQTDKECIRQAIIGKGVNVDASVSLDDYACCIQQIQQGQSFNDWTAVTPDQAGTINNQTYVLGGMYKNNTNQSLCVRGYACICANYTCGSQNTLHFCVTKTSSHNRSDTGANCGRTQSFQPYCSCPITLGAGECAYLHLQGWDSPAQYKYCNTRIEVCTIS